jgi:hypothetical protein
MLLGDHMSSKGIFKGILKTIQNELLDCILSGYRAHTAILFHGTEHLSAKQQLALIYWQILSTGNME